MIELSLPFPPSVNRYWRHVGPRTLLSREGRLFRKNVCSMISQLELPVQEGPLAVAVDLHPPDRRRRDVDNFLKGPLDALEHAGVYHDDAQIMYLEASKHAPVRPGLIVVRIEPYPDFLNRTKTRYELVCCAGCGRDVRHEVGNPVDAYCDRCLGRGDSHAFPEEIDRKPLGEPQWFGGHIQHDLEMGDDFPE